MKPSSYKIGTSDPISYTCSCPAKSSSGSVLLFYRYWANNPSLPPELFRLTHDLASLAAWYTHQTTSLNLGGKIRIAKEGFNVTVGGTSAAIASFIANCASHWSFAGIGLEGSEDARQRFFKPSPGCGCVFEQKANVRVAAEATPMGVEGYAPADWESVIALSPEDFHGRCHEEESVLLDVRNHYESRMGYFISPLTGEPAMRPPIRRFSQWPQFVKGHLEELKGEVQGKQIMTYCTGGIRCEKGVRWMQERLGEGEKVFTLKGGIAAYLDWMNEEIRQGRKTPRDSLFKGKNYVFDARGTVGLDEEELVSHCQICEKLSGRLDKCRSDGCHLVLVVCGECETQDPRCCQDCRDIDGIISDSMGDPRAIRPMCACEKQREENLWAGERVKEPKTQGWRKQRKQRERNADHMDIQVTIVNSDTVTT